MTTSKATVLVQTAMNTEASSDNLWNQTGCIIADSKDSFLSLDKKGQAAAFTKILDDEVPVTEIPEVGMGRLGEEIDLIKKSGKVKWSSWVVTARIVQNTSDIWKGLEQLGYDIVFPNDELISRYELRKLLGDVPKAGETAAETIIRCLELINKKISELDKNDSDSINQRLTDTAKAFYDWKQTI